MRMEEQSVVKDIGGGADAVEMGKTAVIEKQNAHMGWALGGLSVTFPNTARRKTIRGKAGLKHAANL